MRDSSVVKEHDILKNSWIAQLACLDSVMEQCATNESDPTVHRLKRKVDNVRLLWVPDFSFFKASLCWLLIIYSMFGSLIDIMYMLVVLLVFILVNLQFW